MKTDPERSSHKIKQKIEFEKNYEKNLELQKPIAES